MKKILITGGSSGLGYELALTYGHLSNQIIILGRQEEKLISAVNSLNHLGIKSDYITCDLTKETDLSNLRDTIQSRYQTIDVLINNAGIGYFGPFSELTGDQLDKMMDLNVKGTILTTQLLIPFITDKIINIISTAGLKGKVNEAAYVASKFAIRGFTESLQKEYQDKLKIIAVYMGGMDTPFWHDSDHIKDKSRLQSPTAIAKEIVLKDDGRIEIIIEK